MSSYIVYLDHEHAKIFKMNPDGTEKLNLHKHLNLHHQNNQNAVKKDSSPFFHEVAESLKDASEVLVIGHGIAKDQFMNHLKDHKHDKLAKKVVGVESVDKPTDNQILAMARKFFKSEHLFGPH